MKFPLRAVLHAGPDGGCSIVDAQDCLADVNEVVRRANAYDELRAMLVSVRMSNPPTLKWDRARQELLEKYP